MKSILNFKNSSRNFQMEIVKNELVPNEYTENTNETCDVQVIDDLGENLMLLKQRQALYKGQEGLILCKTA